MRKATETLTAFAETAREEARERQSVAEVSLAGEPEKERTSMKKQYRPKKWRMKAGKMSRLLLPNGSEVVVFASYLRKPDEKIVLDCIRALAASGRKSRP